jgi:o-succinylbenzoate synthase
VIVRRSFPVRAEDRATVGAATREAAFVRAEHRGRTGVGECAPLGAGAERWLEECVRSLEAWCAAGRPADGAMLTAMAPPARFAASCAIETASGLGSASHPPVPAASYYGGDPAALDDGALERLRAGGAIKLKVGRAPAAEERRMIERVLEAAPGIPVRLDGNRSLAIEPCASLVRGLPEGRIEYLEEPVVDPSGLARLRATTGIRIALDELIVDASDEARALRDRLSDAGDACAWVVRMSRVGTLDEVRALMRAADGRGCDPVLSTAYESSWTIRVAAHVAHAAGARRRAHGLGTAHVLAEDACRPAALAAGCVPCDALAAAEVPW